MLGRGISMLLNLLNLEAVFLYADESLLAPTRASVACELPWYATRSPAP
jgi:hypothetical protein